MLEREPHSEPQEPTLFDFDATGEILKPQPQPEVSAAEKRIDYLVDTGVADYDTARKIVEAEMGGAFDAHESAEDAQESEEDAPRAAGVSVSLAERALVVEKLMDGISQANRANGASVAVQYDEAFNKRYADPEYVVDAMHDKARGSMRGEAGLIERIAKTEELREAGFTDTQVQYAAHGIKSRLRELRGTGPRLVKERRTEKNVTKRTYKKVQDIIDRENKGK